MHIFGGTPSGTRIEAQNQRYWLFALPLLAVEPKQEPYRGSIVCDPFSSPVAIPNLRIRDEFAFMTIFQYDSFCRTIFGFHVIFSSSKMTCLIVCALIS